MRYQTKEVLWMFTRKGMTVREIARTRGTSERAVQKILQNLRKKGILRSKVPQETKGGVAPEPLAVLPTDGSKFRVHGQKYEVTILDSDRRYLKKVGSVVAFSGARVQCFRNQLVVHVTADFWGKDVGTAVGKGIGFLDRILAIIENDLHVFLVKHRAQNVRLVAQHIAEVHNGIARAVDKKVSLFQIYAKEDGKLWFQCDRSLNVPEAETLHPQTSQEDMEKIKIFLDDLRASHEFRASEIVRAVAGLTGVTTKLTGLMGENTKQVRQIIGMIKFLLERGR